MLFWEDMIALLVCLKYYSFMSNDRLFLWITRVLIFMPWLDIWSNNLWRSENNDTRRELIHLHRIYNFWLFHANIIQLSYTFGKFLYYFLGLTYWSSASVSSCLLHVFGFAENPYETQSKRGKNLWRFFWNICHFWEKESTRDEARGAHKDGGRAPGVRARPWSLCPLRKAVGALLVAQES